jgi:outer membrane protein assembly factor BamD
MNRWLIRATLVGLCLLAFPYSSPAPLVYRAGEGWTYEPIGGGKWVRARAKDQLEVASTALENKDYSLAMRAAKHTVKTWPLSDYAPQAQYIIGRCYEAEKKDEMAFNEYQRLLEKYPKVSNYDEVVKRQYEIANRFLAGQWFKLWGYVPFFPSMERTAQMYEKLIKNGPYSDVAAQAQMSIGTADEKRREYTQAVKAYEKAADRYNDKKQVAADATYKAGLAYARQAGTAEYDQGIAQKAIITFNDFIALFPDDPRIPEAQKKIDSLKTEQARGAYKIAKYYEKTRRPEGALVYYNDVLIKDPNSTYAGEAKQRIEILRIKVNSITRTNAAPLVPNNLEPAK